MAVNSQRGQACPFDAKKNCLALARVKYQSAPLPLNGLNTAHNVPVKVIEIKVTCTCMSQTGINYCLWVTANEKKKTTVADSCLYNSASLTKLKSNFSTKNISLIGKVFFKVLCSM